MKNIFLKTAKFIISRFFYLALGIFLAIGATYVWATWDQARTDGSGQLTEANWNELVTMIENNIGSGATKTMYLTSETFYGNHNCDDNPTTCCASGYHFCDISEFATGGRRLEISGTGRNDRPGDVGGFIDGKGGYGARCNGWTSNQSEYLSILAAFNGSDRKPYFLNYSACNSKSSVWCCQD